MTRSKTKDTEQRFYSFLLMTRSTRKQEKKKNPFLLSQSGQEPSRPIVAGNKRGELPGYPRVDSVGVEMFSLFNFVKPVVELVDAVAKADPDAILAEVGVVGWGAVRARPPNSADRFHAARIALETVVNAGSSLGDHLLLPDFIVILDSDFFPLWRLSLFMGWGLRPWSGNSAVAVLWSLEFGLWPPSFSFLRRSKTLPSGVRRRRIGSVGLPQPRFLFPLE